MQKLIFGSLLLAAVPSLSYAEDTANTYLPETVVTATRSTIDKHELATAGTVYTRKDIERLQVKTLPELLQGATGIDMTQQGGDGKTTSVFMRGTDSSHVLVLIDGIKVGSATLGTTTFEFIPVDQIERVEIIRGPQSSLYGSEAIGGVIQIFTRKGGQSEKPSITLDAGGGNYDTIRGAGTASGKWGNSWYSVGASHYNTQGFNACENNGRCFAGEPDHDGYYNTAVNARVGHHFDNNAEIEATFLKSQGRTEYDGFFQNKTKFINQVASLSASIDVLDNWRSTLRLGHSFDNNNQFAPNRTFAANFYTQRWNATWLNQLTLTDRRQLVFGSDYRLDQVDSSDLNTFFSPRFDGYAQQSRYDVGIFGEWHEEFLDKHFINASLRWDENEAFGNYVTGNVGWRFNSALGISPFASFGNAFKSPTFNDLYYPNYGNPNLQPEESTSVEVGMAGDHDWLQWELRAYHTNIDNLIMPILVNPTTYSYQAKNVSKSQIDGLEGEIGTQVAGWNAKLNMSLLSPRNRIENTRLDRRTQESLSFDLSRSFGQVDVGVNVLAQGNRHEHDRDFITGKVINTRKVAGYATVDLRAAYHFNKNWMINAKLNNLLDKQYQLVDTYYTADRNFFVSIHYNN